MDFLPAFARFKFLPLRAVRLPHNEMDRKCLITSALCMMALYTKSYAN